MMRDLVWGLERSAEQSTQERHGQSRTHCPICALSSRRCTGVSGSCFDFGPRGTLTYSWSVTGRSPTK
jgi:hypothetical protein